MGYLDKSTITVDAILTNRGRELLARGGVGASGFTITKFALADDEVDYGLYNVNQGDSSTLYGAIIENMPVLEATPDEQQIMRYKLTSLQLSNGEIRIPVLTGLPPTGVVSITAGASNNTTWLTTENLANVTRTNASVANREEYTLIISNYRQVNLRINGNSAAVDLPSSAVSANGSAQITIPVAGTLQQSITFVRPVNSSGQLIPEPGKATVTIFGSDSGATGTFIVDVS